MFYRVRNFFVIAVLIIAAFIFQYSVLGMIPYFSGMPDLLLILTVMLGYVRGKIPGLLTGFFSGLLIDIFYANVLGFNALLLMLIGFVCGICNRYFYSDSLFTPALLISGSFTAYCVIYYFFMYALNSNFEIGYVFIRVLLPGLLLTLLFGLLFTRPLIFCLKKMYMFYDIKD